jgi:short-subunit dehydrogenase
MNRTWVVVGATSIIAEQFAHLAAKKGYALRLVGRNIHQLKLIAADLALRHHISCCVVPMDATQITLPLEAIFAHDDTELDVLITHSDFTENATLSHDAITHLVHTNIHSTLQLIQAYWSIPQKEHHLIYLSSVASTRGRAKNSMYGASKAAIEVYLEGLQQAATDSQHITIARLGFIDTRQTYGMPGIFYKAPPKACAKACWHANQYKKRLLYYPYFWRMIMGVIGLLPFFIYRRMKI